MKKFDAGRSKFALSNQWLFEHFLQFSKLSVNTAFCGHDSMVVFLDVTLAVLQPCHPLPK